METVHSVTGRSFHLWRCFIPPPVHEFACPGSTKVLASVTRVGPGLPVYWLPYCTALSPQLLVALKSARHLLGDLSRALFSKERSAAFPPASGITLASNIYAICIVRKQTSTSSEESCFWGWKEPLRARRVMGFLRRPMHG